MKQFIQRQEYNKKLWYYKDQDLIKVVTGMRRSGKSTLLEMFRLQLIDSGVPQNKIQFYNFELPENYLQKTWETLYFDIKAKLQPDSNNYIYF